jgi:hypothetical protein
MTADVKGSQRTLRNIVARFRQQRSGAVRPSQHQAPEVARLQAAMDMHELGVRLYRQRMHREHPRSNRADIDRMVKTWLAEPPRNGQLRMPSRERDRDIR